MLNLFFANSHGGVSVKGAALPIWITDSFRPARVRLIPGMTELRLGLDIVRELDISVVFGGDHFRVGQGELEMMTYNGKHHCVLHLVPTACAYAKLNDYFRKMQKGQIEVLKAQGDCGGPFGSSVSNKEHKSKVTRGSRK